LAGLQADNAKLSSQIIESPDRLKHTMQDMNAGLRKEQEAVLGYEKKLREISAKIDALSQVEQEIERCVKVLGECELEMQRLEEVQRQLTAGQENVSRSEANIRDISLKDQVRPGLTVLATAAFRRSRSLASDPSVLGRSASHCSN